MKNKMEAYIKISLQRIHACKIEKQATTVSNKRWCHEVVVYLGWLSDLIWGTLLEETRKNIKETVVVILSLYQPLNSTVLSRHFSTYRDLQPSPLRSYSLDVQLSPSPVLQITCPFLLLCSLHCKMSSTDGPICGAPEVSLPWTWPCKIRSYFG